MTKQEIEKIVAVVLQEVRMDFAGEASNGRTHEAMASQIQVRLISRGVACSVAYIVNVGGSSKSVGTFKVMTYKPVSDEQFDTVIS